MMMVRGLEQHYFRLVFRVLTTIDQHYQMNQLKSNKKTVRSLNSTVL